LGALIPTAPDGNRPVDVFFPGVEPGKSNENVPSAAADGRADTDGGDGSKPSSWDAAASSGRLGLVQRAPAGRADPVAATEGADVSRETLADVDATQALGPGASELSTVGHPSSSGIVLMQKVGGDV
jgi:ParB family chromosome partitioning protein